TGAVAGAFLGLAGVPAHLLQILEDEPGYKGRTYIDQLARKLHDSHKLVPSILSLWHSFRGTALLAINAIPIEDTFAEAFPMTAARLIVTAETPAWALTAGQTTTGYAASVIGCDAEAGVEQNLSPDETPDGRPGVSLLLFAFSRDALQKAVVNRVGQCILTCPTTACYNGLPVVKEKAIRVGGNLRFFGDGWQFSKKVEGRRFWRVPVMDGEFVCEDFFGTTKGVAGGNFLIVGQSQAAALAAAEAAVAAMRRVPGIILPFPGGVVRSGSKVGSR